MIRSLRLVHQRNIHEIHQVAEQYMGSGHPRMHRQHLLLLNRLLQAEGLQRLPVYTRAGIRHCSACGVPAQTLRIPLRGSLSGFLPI